MGWLRKILGISRDQYKLEALVSSRIMGHAAFQNASTHVICDLDKTYVETEFESWVKMAKIPFERPHEKITVAGASEVLAALSSRYAASANEIKFPLVGVHFVSSSPPQLRTALEGKLVLDQLDWTSDTFKNQSYNLRMARIDLLRHHIAYKTKAILDVVAKIPSGATLWMIGDNAEYDAFIYTGVRLFLAGAIDDHGLAGWLISAKVESRVLNQVIAGVRGSNERGVQVGGILIRRLPHYPVVRHDVFSSGIYMFDSWLQNAWIWFVRGLLARSSWWPIVRAFHNSHGVPLEHLAWCHAQALNLPLPEAVKETVVNVCERISRMGVKAHKVLPWEFELMTDWDIDTVGRANISAEATAWYRHVELARSMKGR